MASVKRVSILHSEDQLLCSICLHVFTEPVSTPCGHNYCKACLTRHWDTNYVCKCLLCNKTFRRRPEICVNTLISEMAEDFRSCKRQKTSSTNPEPPKPDEVSCDICTDTKLKALKSCLMCPASYCETHLEPHHRVVGLKQHKLIDPVKNLEDYTCKTHDRPLEMFCSTDRMCVCHFCTELDHKSHRIVSLEEAGAGKKAELGKTEAEVQQMIHERQVKIREVKRSVELSKKVADRELADSVQVFTTLIRTIERCQAELINGIEEKQKTAEKEAEDFIKELKHEITRLEEISAELKRLSQTEDHIHLLQNLTCIDTPSPTKDWTKVHVHQPPHVETVRTAVALLDKTLSQKMKKLYDDDLRRIQQYAVDVTLDPDTAYPYLILSEDRKQVIHGCVKKNLPQNAERFSEYACVLGKQNFSGRFYYMVQFKGKSDWTIGVARQSINRKIFKMGPAEGYWTIGLKNGNEYEAYADPHAVPLPVREDLHEVGVFVDYEEGLVSFYDAKARVHLHSYTGCSFTEKLFPFFSLGRNTAQNSDPLTISSLNSDPLTISSQILD